VHADVKYPRPIGGSSLPVRIDRSGRPLSRIVRRGGDRIRKAAPDRRRGSDAPQERTARRRKPRWRHPWGPAGLFRSTHSATLGPSRPKGPADLDGHRRGPPPDAEGVARDKLPARLSGIALVTVHPGSVSPAVLRAVGLVLAVGQDPAKT